MKRTFIAAALVAAVLTACGSDSTDARSSTATSATVGPYVYDRADADNPHNTETHWHAALGVWDCDQWVDDGLGEGIWAWPGTTEDGINRVGTKTYAGLHSHGDGIMHMEPATEEDAGHNATVGRYFAYGGWDVDANGYTFLDSSHAEGDTCPGTDAQGRLVWSVNGEGKTGTPADYKLFDDDVVVIAFLAPDQTLANIGDPPSLQNLPGAATNEGNPMPSTAPAASAAGKPCVAVKDELPKGAPDVPIEPGPPPAKLVTKDLRVGTGALVEEGATVTVNYVLVACSTGAVIDSSYGAEPFTADLAGGLIAGWQKGIPGMRVGGRRLLVVPPDLGYGAEGSGPVAPNETLWFVVDAVELPAR